MYLITGTQRNIPQMSEKQSSYAPCRKEEERDSIPNAGSQLRAKMPVEGSESWKNL